MGNHINVIVKSRKTTEMLPLSIVNAKDGARHTRHRHTRHGTHTGHTREASEGSGSSYRRLAVPITHSGGLQIFEAQKTPLVILKTMSF